jgi:uncharacterized iron-regulated membrane protein
MKHQQQPILFVVGLALLLIGLIIRYSVGHRRFSRRNPFGNPQFRGYNQSLVTRGGEGCAKVIGTVLVLAGLLLVLVGLA